MKGKVNELYCYLVEMDDDEGVAFYYDGEGGPPNPLITSTRERAEKLTPDAQDLANVSGKPVRLVRFTERTVIKTVQPRDRN